VTIHLRNGFYYGACKGTAWFSDVKIEKKDMSPSTDWNFLCIIYENIDVTVNFKRNKEYNYQNSFSKSDIKNITSVLKKIPKSFSNISKNLMTVGTLDIVTVEEPLTKITGKFGRGYCIEARDIKDTIDLYSSKKSYNQIILIAPLGELADGWYGLGGGFYNDVGYVQVTIIPGENIGLPVFPDGVFIHETLHCLESHARSMKEIAELHDGEKYGYNGENEWIEWYSAYMRNTLPDGKGLPKEVYTVYNGRYNTISKNMK
jgi:hypothetical protein